jgi:hypothetical protein
MPKNTGRIIGTPRDHCEAPCLSARKGDAVLWSSNLVYVPHHILAAIFCSSWGHCRICSKRSLSRFAEPLNAGVPKWSNARLERFWLRQEKEGKLHGRPKTVSQCGVFNSPVFVVRQCSSTRRSSSVDNHAPSKTFGVLIRHCDAVIRVHPTIHISPQSPRSVTYCPNIRNAFRRSSFAFDHKSILPPQCWDGSHTMR